MKSSVAVNMGTLNVLACGMSLLALMPAFALAAESPLTQAINRITADSRQERVIELRELGIDRPIILNATDARRELYLPVPANVPLTDATLNFDASYLNGEAGRNTLLLSLDGYPVRALGLNEEQGNASAVLGVDKAARESGSVRLGIAWSSVISKVLCEDERAIGNVLRIDPHTRLTYGYDASQLQDVGAAWNALPGKPGLLVAPGTLSSASYDAAWRLGVALERIGKQARILPFPAVQDSVDLSGLTIPAELKQIPAFAGLEGKGQYTLRNPAEIGALLMLGQTPALQADLAISDPQLLKAIDDALNALQAQVQGLDATAAAALGQWRERHIKQPLANSSEDVSLALQGNRALLMIKPESANKAIGLFSSAWNKLARNRQLTIGEEAAMPLSEDGRVALTRLGGKPGTVDVLAKTDWSASFPLGSVAYDGRVPVTAMIDVAAAPGASGTPPVATLFLNDYLIGAMQLTADGKKERIEARIPQYALAAQNTLRVSFQRQPVSNQCLETPQAFPISVLPTSHVVLDKITPDENFSGMAARFATDTQIMVPKAYLERPASSLPQVIRVASASGVSPLRAQLSVSDDASVAVTPAKAFLAFELPVKDGAESVKASNDGHLLINHKEQTLLDLKSLNHLASLQVIDAGGQHGMVYRTLGGQAPVFERPLLLERGNATLLADNGPIATFDAKDPTGSQMIEDEQSTGLDAWRKPSLLWLIPAGIVLFLILLLAGRSARRNRS
ncbi:cellulose biosynthesis cyclic di-GMP-binding regulatory protein BcsB [Pseudomonas syringae group sp. 243L2]|uniref:cellulose biosynthesis cyclic di-GMP-binding regulatory protein BcsB n=1 Tax=Pseudomonas syringae group sp. 243L2 TaxID=3079593 RepID=UPI0029089532|nr:cellulose biosynthesis cyclic di-GMP-binding regulatory protein BcsB [Pseudomonas syringae group sp. 243L2]MDU8627871.1 cellulose biosynthesis cyclic di-GMP-binding regulatory protein BcsB [Pseudomonas syringae group sp. 243L2]